MRGGFVPGDVALVNCLGEYKRAMFAVDCARAKDGHPEAPHWHVPTGRYLENDGRYVRRLVVIDPEDREQVERLTRIIFGPLASAAGDMASYLREFADPKPEEPLGLGAVVEDADGNRYVRTEPDGGIAKWIRSRAPEATDPRYVWSALPAVRVLSEGVTDE